MSFSVIKWFSQSPEPSKQPKVELKASELVELCLEFDFHLNKAIETKLTLLERKEFEECSLAFKTFCENHNIEWDYE